MKFSVGDKVTFGPFPSITKEKTFRKPTRSGKFSSVTVNPRRPMLGTIVDFSPITDTRGNEIGTYYHIEDSNGEWIWKVREEYIKLGYEDFSAALDLAEELPGIVKTYLGYSISQGKGSKGPDGKFRDLSFSIDSWRITLNKTTSYSFYDRDVALEFYEDNLAIFEKYIRHIQLVEQNFFTDKDIPQIEKISTNISLENLLELFKSKGTSMTEIHNKHRGIVVGKNVGII